MLYDLANLPSAPAALLDWIDDTWLHGTMSTDLRSTLEEALANPAANTPLNKQRLALYLAAMSPEFQTQR